MRKATSVSLALMGVFCACVHLAESAAGLKYHWERVPGRGPTPSGRQMYASAYHNHTAYIVGGAKGQFGAFQDLDDMWAYDYDTNLWEEVFIVGRTPYPRLGSVDARMAGVNESLYMFGGGDSNYLYNELWRFDLKLHLWERLDPLDHYAAWPVARRGFCFFERHGELILMGGLSAYDKHTDVWKYNIHTHTWTKLSEAGGWHGGHGVSCAYKEGTDEVWAFGGAGRHDPNIENQETYMYNFTGKWYHIETTGTKPSRRQLHGSFITGDELVVAWGESQYNNLHTHGIYALNLSSRVWRTVEPHGDHPHVRHSFEFLKVSDTKVLAFGGAGEHEPLNEMISLDMKTETISIKHHHHAYPNARRGHGAVSIGTDMYIFGGTGDKNQFFNDLWKMNANGTWEHLPHKTLFPTARDGAAMAAFGNEILLHGGHTEAGEHLGDLWSYSINTGLWEEKTAQAASHSTSGVPTARAFHTLTLVGRKMYLFGGEDDLHKNAELWSLEPRELKWALHSNITSLVVGNFSLIAEAHASLFNRKHPVPRSGHAAAVMTRKHVDHTSPHRLVILGGAEGQELHDLWLFDPVRNTWAPRPTELHNFPGRHDHVMIANGDHVVTHGGNSYDVLHSEVSSTDIPFKESDMTPSTHYTFTKQAAHSFTAHPHYLAGHTSARVGNSMVIFGGYSSLPSAITHEAEGRFRYVSNAVWKLVMEPICEVVFHDNVLHQNASAHCFVCAAGSKVVRLPAGNHTCELCPKGYYGEHEGAVECSPCPAGFHSDVVGAASHLNCIACPVGTYAPHNGSSTCLPCPTGKFCPIASAEPLLGTLEQHDDETHVLHTQPPPYPRRSQEVSDRVEEVTLYGWVATGIILGVLLLMAAVSSTCGHYIAKMDFLFSEQHIPTTVHEDKSKGWQTPVGGAFTVATVASCITLLTLVLLPWIDNVQETRSLVPNLAVAHSETKTLRSDMAIQFALLHYGDQCTVSGSDGECAEHIELTTHGIVTVSANGSHTHPDTHSSALRCEKRGHVFNAAAEAAIFGDSISAEESRVCVVTWTCPNCAITTTTATAKFGFDQERSYASAITWNVSMSTGINNKDGVQQNSTAQGRVVPSSGAYSFRGPNPAIITLSVSQSRFENLMDIFTNLGYVLQFTSQVAGSQVDSLAFQDEHGLNFTVALVKTDRTFEVTWSQIQDVYTFVAAAMGTVSGQLGLMAAVLFGFEMALVYVLARFGSEDLKRNMLKMEKVREYEELKEQESVEEVLARLNRLKSSRSLQAMAQGDSGPEMEREDSGAHLMLGVRRRRSSQNMQAEMALRSKAGKVAPAPTPVVAKKLDHGNGKDLPV